MAPTGGPAWTTDLVNGDHFSGASSTPAAVAGYPSITVPAGEVFGLPVGVSFIGRAWSEQKLIALAYAYEQATKRRRPPQFKRACRKSASRASLVVVAQACSAVGQQPEGLRYDTSKHCAQRELHVTRRTRRDVVVAVRRRVVRRVEQVLGVDAQAVPAEPIVGHGIDAGECGQLHLVRK